MAVGPGVLVVRGLVLVVVALAAGHLVVTADGVVAGAGDELLAIAAALLAVVRLAAADREEPEQTSGEGECETDPDTGEEVAVEATLNTVRLADGLDGADDDDSHSSGETGGGEREEDGHNADQSGEARDDSCAVGEDTNQQLDTQRNKGDDESDLGVLSNGGENIKSRLHLAGELD